MIELRLKDLERHPHFENISEVAEFVLVFYPDLINKIENASFGDGKTHNSLKCSILSLCLQAAMKADTLYKNSNNSNTYIPGISDSKEELLFVAYHITQAIEILTMSFNNGEDHDYMKKLNCDATKELKDFIDEFIEDIIERDRIENERP